MRKHQTSESLLVNLESSIDSHFFFSGPLLHTLCTAIIDLDEQTLSIIAGNPKNGDISHVFSISSKHKSLHDNNCIEA